MNTHTIPWMKLKRRWLDIQAGRVEDPARLTEDRPEFRGATIAQTTQWVERGYDLPGFTSGSVNFQPRKRRRAQWNNEQGRIDVTRALCGDENYRLTRSPREYRHGSTVEIGYGFRAGVDAETIGQYGKFCAGIIRKLEGEGLDVAVDIVSRSISYIVGIRDECELKIRVKQVNERADFRAWSALFAPSGHRHLIFCGRSIHAEDVGRKVKPGMGGSQHRGWKVERDGDTIRIDCNSFRSGDPTSELETQARTAGIL